MDFEMMLKDVERVREHGWTRMKGVPVERADLDALEKLANGALKCQSRQARFEYLGAERKRGHSPAVVSIAGRYGVVLEAMRAYGHLDN